MDCEPFVQHDPSRTRARRLTDAAARIIAPGETLDGRILGVDWARNQRTLVLAISTVCHFCKDSLPFYREIGATGTDVRLVAVLPQPVVEARKFFKRLRRAY